MGIEHTRVAHPALCSHGLGDAAIAACDSRVKFIGTWGNARQPEATHRAGRRPWAARTDS